MENASKALIIAGAILISILLISVGILVMNSTGDVQQSMEDEMNSTAIQTFNSKFSGYIGTQSGTIVRSLCSIVTASNASSAYQVEIEYNGTTYTTNSDIATLSASINTKNNYTVVVSDESGDGYYDKITITDA